MEATVAPAPGMEQAKKPMALPRRMGIMDRFGWKVLGRGNAADLLEGGVDSQLPQGGNVRGRRQSLLAGHGQDAHLPGLHLGQGLSRIGIEHVQISSQEGDHGFAPALEGDIVERHPGRFFDHMGNEGIRAGGVSPAGLDLSRPFFGIVDEVLHRFVRRIGFYSDEKIIIGEIHQGREVLVGIFGFTQKRGG